MQLAQRPGDMSRGLSTSILLLVNYVRELLRRLADSRPSHDEIITDQRTGATAGLLAARFVCRLIRGRGHLPRQYSNRYDAERLDGIPMKILLSWSSGKDSAWALHGCDLLTCTPHASSG
jgi:hypothetical protein